jgi:hypothetical protein
VTIKARISRDVITCMPRHNSKQQSVTKVDSQTLIKGNKNLIAAALRPRRPGRGARPILVLISIAFSHTPPQQSPYKPTSLTSSSILHKPSPCAKIFSLNRCQQLAEHDSLGRVDRNMHLEATGCSTGERPVLLLPALRTHTCEFVSTFTPFTRAQTCTHTIYVRI